jgi:hypothetical protein
VVSKSFQIIPRGINSMEYWAYLKAKCRADERTRTAFLLHSYE